MTKLIYKQQFFLKFLGYDIRDQRKNPHKNLLLTFIFATIGPPYHLYTLYPLDFRPHNYVNMHLPLDVDECQTASSCPDVSDCINTIGSYNCVCWRGYQASSSGSNNKECVGKSGTHCLSPRERTIYNRVSQLEGLITFELGFILQW